MNKVQLKPMTKLSPLISLLLVTALLLPVTATAGPHHHEQIPHRFIQLAQQKVISKSQAINIAKRKHRGRVLSAELAGGGKHPFYKVKLLTGEGRVKTVRVDARGK